MKQKPKYLYCCFEPCNKRLIDFCFLCKEDSNVYCDEICAERNLEAKAPREVLTWQ